jgi:hypothetical protein
MQINEGKDSFLLRIKLANYDVIYQTFNKYSISLYQEIILAMIQIFQIISLTINAPVKIKLFTILVKTFLEWRKFL